MRTIYGSHAVAIKRNILRQKLSNQEKKKKEGKGNTLHRNKKCKVREFVSFWGVLSSSHIRSESINDAFHSLIYLHMKKILNNCLQSESSTKVRSSYSPLAYFSDIFISGKNVVISAER